MRYTKKERVEIQKVFEQYIKFIDAHLTSSTLFLCYMYLDIEKVEATNTGVVVIKKCGWNDRMIPNAINYLKSERPTHRLNEVIFNKPCFDKEADIKGSWWLYDSDYGASRDTISVMVNTEKKEFLQHLIKKLR